MPENAQSDGSGCLATAPKKPRESVDGLSRRVALGLCEVRKRRGVHDRRKRRRQGALLTVIVIGVCVLLLGVVALAFLI